MPESLLKKISEIEKSDHTGAPSEGKADKVQKTNPQGDKCSILAAREPTRGHQSTDLISSSALGASWSFPILHE